jgi:hypothetical protein
VTGRRPILPALLALVALVLPWAAAAIETCDDDGCPPGCGDCVACAAPAVPSKPLPELGLGAALEGAGEPTAALLRASPRAVEHVPLPAA